MTDTGVLVLLGLLHVLALRCGVLLIKLLLRELPGWRWWTDDDERRGRGEPSIPPTLFVRGRGVGAEAEATRRARPPARPATGRH